jgi:hypothetical protein
MQNQTVSPEFLVNTPARQIAAKSIAIRPFAMRGDHEDDAHNPLRVFQQITEAG